MKNRLLVLGISFILVVLCLTSCGGTSSTQSDTSNITTEKDSDVTTIQTELNYLNESFSELGYWEYYNDTFIFYDTSDTITPFMDFYYEYGATSEFNKQLNEVIDTFASVAESIDTDENISATIAIANPYNKEKLILILTKDEVLYNLFSE